jgi:hypothetical protein
MQRKKISEDKCNPGRLRRSNQCENELSGPTGGMRGI